MSEQKMQYTIYKYSCSNCMAHYNITKKIRFKKCLCCRARLTELEPIIKYINKQEYIEA